MQFFFSKRQLLYLTDTSSTRFKDVFPQNQCNENEPNHGWELKEIWNTVDKVREICEFELESCRMRSISTFPWKHPKSIYQYRRKRAFCNKITTKVVIKTHIDKEDKSTFSIIWFSYRIVTFGLSREMSVRICFPFWAKIQ